MERCFSCREAVPAGPIKVGVFLYPCPILLSRDAWKHILIYHTYLSYSLCTLHEMYICMLILRCITTFTSITSSMLPSLTIVTLDSLLPWSNNSLAKNTVVWKERCFYSTKYIYWNIYIWSLCELFTLYIYYFTISNTIIYIHMYVWDDILSGVLIYTYISTLYIS